MTVRHIDVADVAKLIRQDLKAVFGQAVKFSVRTSRYSGGSSIRVSYVDGPTVKMVESIIGGYRGGGFDGMTDYKYRFDGFLDGERVRFGGDFLFINREPSDELKRRARRAVGVDENASMISLDYLQHREVMEQLEKRCDSRIAELYARNFKGPRALVDIDQAEKERLSVYPRQERDSQLSRQDQHRRDYVGVTAEKRMDAAMRGDLEVKRYDTPDEAAAAAKRGEVISVMDLIPKRQGGR